MQETSQQYIGRVLGYIEGQDPLKIQAATPQKLVHLLKGVSPAKLRKRPAPGKWSIQEIVAHMADTEIVLGFRMRMILGAPGTPLAGFDQDAWVVAGHYSKRDVRVALEQFSALRKADVALLKTLDPAQWKHAGMHSERGEQTIDMIVRMTAGHDINHLAQIERIVKPPKSA